MAQLIRIRQDLIVSTDSVDRVFIGSVLLKSGESFSITPPVWAAFQDAAHPPPNVDVTPFEERDGMSVPTIGGIAQTFDAAISVRADRKSK